jgi:hypothetical protein
MKNWTSLLAVVVVFCLVRVDPLWGQRTAGGRMVFDQAHGEEPPPVQLYGVAKKLDLEILPSAEMITDEVLEGARMPICAPPRRNSPSTRGIRLSPS